MANKTNSCSVGGACGVGLIGLFCPLCIPAIATFLSSIGLGVLATKEVVWPLLGIFTLLYFTGLVLGWRQHRNFWPLVVGVLGALLIPFGRYVVAAAGLSYVGVALVVVAAIWNILLRRK